SINNAVIKSDNNQAVDVSGYDKNTSEKNVSIESIVFFGDEEYLRNKWYAHVNKCYVNILKDKKYNINLQNILPSNKLISTYPHKELIKIIKDLNQYTKKGILCIFNPVNFAILLHIYIHSPSEGKTAIQNLLKQLKYILLWQEVIEEDLFITGYDRKTYDCEFLKIFFKNSLLTLTSNLRSLRSLNKQNIDNCQYFSVMGYSKLNNIIPITPKTPTIDILIYGSRILSKTYKYRTELIEKIQTMNSITKYNLKIFEDNFEFDCDLERTQIVVHVPSFPNLPHMPWAKITSLQSKKIFFIIEENDEMYEKGFESFTVYYKRNDIEDLYKKIDYFLDSKNLNERQEYVEKHFQYIYVNNNMEEKIPKIINSLSV
ncbi:MAG: hypothetical protein WD512_01920, partial [Candidatus Paceibacterota bacterium]